MKVTRRYLFLIALCIAVLSLLYENVLGFTTPTVAMTFRRHLPLSHSIPQSPTQDDRTPPSTDNNGTKDRIIDLPVGTSDSPNYSVSFVDAETHSIIDCYSYNNVIVNDQEYTMGYPCDTPVALCHNDHDDPETVQPVDLEDDLMNELFPIAESLVEEKYGADVKLLRTPNILTIVGDFDNDVDEEEEEKEDDNVEYDRLAPLLTFQHQEKKYHLAQLLDPACLVGKVDAENTARRWLLTEQESVEVFPRLDKLFEDWERSEGVSA